MSSDTHSANPDAGAHSDTHAAIDAVWRIESPRLIAGLTRITRDIGAAEDLAHDALVAALEQWPTEGVPSNPGAWLMAAAKHRAIDLVRRRSLLDRKHSELGRELEEKQENSVPDYAAALDDDIGDCLLYTSCWGRGAAFVRPRRKILSDARGIKEHHAYAAASTRGKPGRSFPAGSFALRRTAAARFLLSEA